MERHTDGLIDKWTDKQSVRKNIHYTKMTERHMYRQKDGQRNTLTWTEVQTDRQIDKYRQTDKHTARQTDRQTDRQTGR
jgi:hypothetical protein